VQSVGTWTKLVANLWLLAATTCYILYSRAEWAAGPAWTGAENLVPTSGFDPRTAQNIASRNSDWAIPAALIGTYSGSEYLWTSLTSAACPVRGVVCVWGRADAPNVVLDVCQLCVQQILELYAVQIYIRAVHFVTQYAYRATGGNNLTNFFKYVRSYTYTLGCDSSVDIATSYLLDGTAIESRCEGRDFPHPSRPALWPTQHPIQWVPGLCWWVQLQGRGAEHPPHI